VELYDHFPKRCYLAAVVSSLLQSRIPTNCLALFTTCLELQFFLKRISANMNMFIRQSFNLAQRTRQVKLELQVPIFW
jgi:hypothetical protein